MAFPWWHARQVLIAISIGPFVHFQSLMTYFSQTTLPTLCWTQLKNRENASFVQYESRPVSTFWCLSDICIVPGHRCVCDSLCNHVTDYLSHPVFCGIVLFSATPPKNDQGSQQTWIEDYSNGAYCDSTPPGPQTWTNRNLHRNQLSENGALPTHHLHPLPDLHCHQAPSAKKASGAQPNDNCIQPEAYPDSPVHR